MDQKLQKIIDTLSELTILELNALNEGLQESWGVTAAVAVMAGAGGAAPVAEAAEEKDSYNVILKSIDESKKMGIIKILRELTGLGLKEAKELSEKAGAMVKEAVSKDEGDKIKKSLTDAGAVVELA